MRWLVRAMSLPGVLGVSFVAGLVAGLLRGASAPVPSLTHGSLVPVPLVAVLAALPPSLAVAAWLKVPQASLAVSARSALRSTLVLACTPVVYAAASALLGGAGAALENGRDAFGLLGLALIGLRLLGERGALLAPLAYLLAAFLVGRRRALPSPDVWAWVLRDGGDLSALALAAVSAVLGLALSVAVPRAQVRRGER